VEEDGECFRIFRIEDASPQELAVAFLEATRGFTVPAGSVVVLSSASHMAWVGAAAYAQDFAIARVRLRAAFGGGIEVIHGLPLLMCGVSNMASTLAIKDVANWLASLNVARGLNKTFGIFQKFLKCNEEDDMPLASSAAAGPSLTPAAGTASPLAAATYRLNLPTSLDRKEYGIFEMSHHLKDCTDIKPFDHEMAAELVSNMAAELNSSYMAGLGEPLIVQCEEEDIADMVEENKFSQLKMVFVGGSHAYRLAAAAENLGIDTENLAVPGFRVSEKSIENTVELLSDTIMSCDKRVVIVYHLYDNNVFLSSKDDGSRSLPTKVDNTYHVEGRLVFADHHCMKHLVNLSVPVLRAGGDHEKIILSPLLRYLKPCCRDKSHITNRKEPEYFKELGSAVSDMRESVKDIVYGKKIRNFKVLEPVSLLATDEDDEAAAAKLMPYFKEDPVHLSSDGYAEILQGLLDFIFEGSFTRTPKPSCNPSTSQTRRDWSRSRKNWVNQDDTVAKRSDLIPQKKFHPRGKNPRGHGGRGSGRGGRGGHDPSRGGYNNRGGSSSGGSYNNSWRGNRRFKPY
jgi:uncharacterized membrane protein YgcG